MRDKPHIYRHEPSAQGVDYSPFIMETLEKSSEKMETTPAAPRRSFPPPICSSRSLFRGFCVSVALPFKRCCETIFIGVFRSRRSFWKKDRRHRSHEGQVDGSHAAKEYGRVGPPLLAFGLPLFLLPSLPRLVPSKKPMLVNFQVIWTSFGSLKVKNMEKVFFWFCRVNSK